MTNTVLYGDKTITYSESFWTGKKVITINGETLQKIDRKTYKHGDKYCTLKGNYITGVELIDSDQHISLVRKLTFFEIILCFLPLVILIQGGAIGGFCGGVAATLNAVYMRKNDKIIMKILYSIVATAVAFLCYIIIGGGFLLLIPV